MHIVQARLAGLTAQHAAQHARGSAQSQAAYLDQSRVHTPICKRIREVSSAVSVAPGSNRCPVPLRVDLLIDKLTSRNAIISPQR